MSAPNKNLEFLYPLLILTWIFCAFPHNIVKNPQSRKAYLFHKILSALRVLFWLILAIGGIFKEAIKLKQPEETKLPVLLMSLVLQCVLALFSVSILISLGFVHYKSIDQLFKNLDQVDFKLDFKLGKTSWKFYLHFLVFFVLQVIHGYYNYALWHIPVKTSYLFLHIYVIRIIQIFQFSLIVFTTNTLCFHLYQRFKLLNSLFRKFNPFNDILELRLHVDQAYKNFIFKELKKVHAVLCDQVDNVNDIFGWLLLCFVLASIAMTCFFVVHVLTLIIFDLDLSHIRRQELLAVSISGIVFIAIEVIFLAWVGALLSSETAKTHKISYALLNNLPHSNEKGTMEHQFRKELKSLAIQSGFRQPCISANGIFKLDFSILIPVFGSVSSYIIVTQQFLLQYVK